MFCYFILIGVSWPSGRVYASRWTDLDGNFWLFGGNGTGDTFGTRASMKYT